MKIRSNFVNIFLFIIVSFMISGCSDNEDTQIKKIAKQYSYFYEAKDRSKEFSKQQTVYLPVYSHVYTSEEKNEPMGITLSIRNTDHNESLLIEEIAYYNTAGDLIESYIDTPHILKPMASIEFVVDLADMRGGSGANFIIKWARKEKIMDPIIQAVMVNNSGNRAFSFITEGKSIK